VVHTSGTVGRASDDIHPSATIPTITAASTVRYVRVPNDSRLNESAPLTASVSIASMPNRAGTRTAPKKRQAHKPRVRRFVKELMPERRGPRTETADEQKRGRECVERERRPPCICRAHPRGDADPRHQRDEPESQRFERCVGRDLQAKQDDSPRRERPSATGNHDARAADASSQADARSIESRLPVSSGIFRRIVAPATGRPCSVGRGRTLWPMKRHWAWLQQAQFVGGTRCGRFTPTGRRFGRAKRSREHA